GDNIRRRGSELAWGAWGDWSRRCDAPCGVCGVRTRVDPYHASDISGLNDVKLYCCE
ncbi:VMO1 protein, partial [Emberiza fucata]|nr:VMO1 protein [Emberiza fucata]